MHKLMTRQKQIDFGKNTVGYDNYLRHVPKDQRDPSKSLTEHPVTPNKYAVTSKRAFDGIVRKWRRLLHRWDDAAPDVPTSAEIAKLPHPSSAPPSPHPSYDTADTERAESAENAATASDETGTFGGGMENVVGRSSPADSEGLGPGGVNPTGDSEIDEALALAAQLAE